jgi:hypothetical protein
MACSSSPPKVDDGLRSVVRDGGSAVVDAGHDAGLEPPVRLRDLELASFLVDRRTYLGDAGPLLFVISPGDLVARWRTRDGGWAMATGFEQADAGYRIPNVPEGETYVGVVGSRVLVTTSNVADLSLTLGGRVNADRAMANEVTEVDWFLDNTLPWEAEDRIVYASFEAAFAAESTYVPPVGSTSSGVRIPFERYLIPLAEGSKGDTASLFQIRAVDVADGGMRVRVAVAGGTVVSPDMVPGEASTVTVPFSTADSGASFDLDFPDFIATAQQDLPFTPTAVEPNLTVFSIPGYRRIGVVLTGWYGNLTAMSVVQTATIRPDLPPQRVTLDWVDLFAEENLATRVLARLRVPLRGPTFNSSFELVSHRFSPLFKGVPVDVRGVMSAPRDLRLDGQPAVARSGVGLTPTLSWTPPARGNPVAYDVRVWAFPPNTLPQGVAVFRTTQTRLTLPPSTLTAGTVYGLEIIALAGSYEPLRPRFLPPDSTVSSSITELFLP